MNSLPTRETPASVAELLRSVWQQGPPKPCEWCGKHYSGMHSWYRYRIIGEPHQSHPQGPTQVQLITEQGPLCGFCFAVEINRVDDASYG